MVRLTGKVRALFIYYHQMVGVASFVLMFSVDFHVLCMITIPFLSTVFIAVLVFCTETSLAFRKSFVCSAQCAKGSNELHYTSLL